MFIQHPVYAGSVFVAATAYSMWLNGVGKVLKINFLLTIPSLLIVALLNPMFNHYGVTPLLYIESNGTGLHWKHWYMELFWDVCSLS